MQVGDTGHARQATARENMRDMRTLTWVALMGAAVGGAGCGGLSRKQLVKRTDAICARYAKQGRALGSPDLTDLAKAEPFFTKAAGLARRQQAELRDLDASGDAEKDFTALTDATGKATKLLAGLGSAAGARQQARFYGLVQQLESANQGVNDAAKALGARSC